MKEKNKKRGKYQQITVETNPTKLKSRSGYMVITKDDCIGLYSSKADALNAGLEPIAIIPVIVDYYADYGLN